ncbi:MAG: glutathione S-transferase [Myxococcales bacterium]|nr:glutathione S-transferase [Myxococcales bacterium]
MITICGFPISNYYNKVRLAAAEKGIEYKDDASVFPSQDAALLARSPMGKIPFLETEHGLICESQVICEYLEDRFPEKSLYPADPYARAKVRELIQVLELHIELVARRLLGAALFGASASDETKAEVKRDLDKGLRAVTHLAKFSPYLAGNEFTLADCCAAVHFPLISLVTKIIYGEDILVGIPQVEGYMKLLGERPTVQKIWAERDATFQAVMASRKKSS